MSLLDILAMLLAGIVSSNCVVGTASGVELSLSGSNSLKNATYYFCIISSVALLSFLTSYVLSLILTSIGISKFLFFVNIVIVAVYVQIAEYICSKTIPLFLKESYGFVTALCFTAFIMLTSTSFLHTTFVTALIKLVFECLGIWLILLIMAGIRQNKKYYGLPNYFKGNTLNMIILLVIFVIMYAF